MASLILTSRSCSTSQRLRAVPHAAAVTWCTLKSPTWGSSRDFAMHSRMWTVSTAWFPPFDVEGNPIITTYVWNASTSRCAGKLVSVQLQTRLTWNDEQWCNWIDECHQHWSHCNFPTPLSNYVHDVLVLTKGAGQGRARLMAEPERARSYM